MECFSGLRVTLRCPWKAITSLFGDFLKRLLKLAVDQKFAFPRTWVGEHSLPASFPVLHRLSSLQNMPISNFVEDSHLISEKLTNWNLHFFLNLNNRKVPQLQDLLVRLERVILCSSLENRRVRLGD